MGRRSRTQGLILTDSEELGAVGNTLEAETFRLVTCDSESDGIGEEPFEVALSTIAIEDLMPGLRSEEEKHCRTVNAVTVWRTETCKNEFEKMAALAKAEDSGGQSGKAAAEATQAAGGSRISDDI